MSPTQDPRVAENAVAARAWTGSAINLALIFVIVAAVKRCAQWRLVFNWHEAKALFLDLGDVGDH